MKIDIGFWNQQGEYIQDIQEINKMDMDKYFEELNDMANFKGFGEKKETECEYCEDCSFCKGCFKLQQENEELKAENERLNRCLMEELHHEGEALKDAIKYK